MSEYKQPWEIIETHERDFIFFDLYDSDGDVIGGFATFATKENYNALKKKMQLIEAAPELLAKLENLYRRLRQTSEKGTCGRDEIAKVIYTQKEIDEIDKLLAKAKGEV